MRLIKQGIDFLSRLIMVVAPLARFAVPFGSSW